MKKITVIGCGVIGLTTAITLERAGYEVKIVTKNLHFKTTSAIAAAIWMPYKADPADLVNQWSLETYHILEKQSLDPISGISMVDLKYLSQTDEIPSWEDAAPSRALRKAEKTELPSPYSYGYIAHIPLIETPIYLEYLFDEFRGEILLDEILSFEEIESSDSLIINCTGLGSRILAEDNALYPVKGQIVKIKTTENIICAADDHPDHFFYIIPRRDCIVLGGSSEPYNFNPNPNDDITRTIFERAQKVDSKIKESDLLAVETGFRPYRPSIRLEKDPERNIIHNYGHGGSGFTVSWGCSKAVLDIVEQIF